MPASLVDTNVWLAASFPRHPHQMPAALAITSATPEPRIFCRVVQISFLRLLTTPALLRQYRAEGFTNRDALEVLRVFLARPQVREMDEPPGTAALWRSLAARDTASPKAWMDAYLAAFAISGGLDFVTLDRDFKTYEAHGLRLRLLADAATP
jgi:toxin-antitoxin system PIN domain toxin